MGRENWETPDYFFRRCSDRWGLFGLDAAASKDNHKCGNFLTEEMDALSCEWVCPHGSVWLNPPYRRGEIIRWTEKAISESDGGLRVVMLLLADTSTAWFHLLLNRAEICFTKGRIAFLDENKKSIKGNTHGSIVAVLHPPGNASCGVIGTIQAAP